MLSQENHGTNLSQTSTSSTRQSSFDIIIEGKQFVLGSARFIDDAQIEVVIDEVPFLYNRTKKEYHGKVYFQCINRKKGKTTGNKCLAKANYILDKKSFEVINLHNPNCSNVQLNINHDYQAQRDMIISSLEENNSLTTINAMNILRNRNNAESEENKKQPLKYRQVKKIISNFRQENNLNSQFNCF